MSLAPLRDAKAGDALNSKSEWTRQRLISALKRNKARGKQMTSIVVGVGWTAVWVIAAFVVLNPGPDEYTDEVQPRNWIGFSFLIAFGVLALLWTLRKIFRTAAEWRSDRDPPIAAAWLQSAGPDVKLMILDGGPRLAPGTRVSTAAAHQTLGAVGGAGAHPIIAVGIGVFGLIAKGLIAAEEAPERRRLQAELTAQYRARALKRLRNMAALERQHLQNMSRGRPRSTKTREMKATQSRLSLTNMALALLGDDLDS